MTYDLMPLEKLVPLFVDTLLKASAKPDDEYLDGETAKVAKAIVARGDAGAAALRPLLNDSHEEVQLLAAVWLTELDPYGAAPTLERLERSAASARVGSTAELKLMNNRQRGLLPAR